MENVFFYGKCIFYQVCWGTCKDGNFEPYRIATNTTIEQAYQKKAKYAEWTEKKKKMRVNFEKMMETIVDSRDSSTPVQRKLMQGRHDDMSYL